MLEIRTSGSTSGKRKRSTVRTVGHRQTKGPANCYASPKPPRHFSTLLHSPDCTIQAKPHQKRTSAPGPGCDGVLRIATHLLDVPAEVIAVLYHYRWTIEICIRPNYEG